MEYRQNLDMAYRQLGNSDVKVSVIALGTWAMGGLMWGETDEDQAIAAIRHAVDLGVTTIDTAPIYGTGLSEELVGRATRQVRHKVQILTKCGLQWDSDEGTFHFETPQTNGRPLRVYRNASKKRVLQECDESLRRLKTDYIDLYQLHWPDPKTPLEATCEALGQLLLDQKIRAVGVSNLNPKQMATVRGILPLASDQPPYSLVNRKIEQDVVPWCLKHGVGILAYSPLQRGLLTGKIGMDHQFSENDHRSKEFFFKPGNRRQVLDLLEKIKPIAERHSATLAQLAIHWTIRQPGVCTALVGARNPAQAEENAHAAALRVSDAEIAEMTRLTDELKLE